MRKLFALIVKLRMAQLRRRDTRELQAAIVTLARHDLVACQIVTIGKSDYIKMQCGTMRKIGRSK